MEHHKRPAPIEIQKGTVTTVAGYYLWQYGNVLFVVEDSFVLKKERKKKRKEKKREKNGKKKEESVHESWRRVQGPSTGALWRKNKAMTHLLMMVAFIQRYSPLSSRLTALVNVILHEWLAFYSAFLNIQPSGGLTALTWMVPPETAAVSAQVMCTPYNRAPCHIMQSHVVRCMSI